MNPRLSAKVLFVQPEGHLLDEITIQKNLTIPPRAVNIHKDHQGYQEAIQRLYCYTEFLGQSTEVIYRNTELFTDLLTKPYLDYKRDWNRSPKAMVR